MIGIDTNVLLRYILQDDPEQSPRATRAIEGFTRENPGFLSAVAIAEASWVLRRAYYWTTEEVAAAIEFLIQAESLVVQNETQVYFAMIAFKKGGPSFSDALIAEFGKWSGCNSTLTFDKKASRSSGFTLL